MVINFTIGWHPSGTWFPTHDPHSKNKNYPNDKTFHTMGLGTQALSSTDCCISWTGADSNIVKNTSEIFVHSNIFKCLYKAYYVEIFSEKYSVH